MKLNQKILKGFLVTMAIIGLSSLPYLHEVITSKANGVYDWVPNFGIEQALTDINGKVLGFSTYRIFLYTLLIFLFSGIGWFVWLIVSKGKSYFYALYIPILLTIYQITMIVFALRRTWVNDWDIKLYLILGLSIIFALIYLLKENKFTPSIIFKWLLIIGATSLPFFHDIVTDRSSALKAWVPFLGIENLFTDADGRVGGFGSYRAFIYYLLLHLYAHLGWLGSFLYYNLTIKKIRPFLLVPVITSLYSVVIFLFNWQEMVFNKPNVKFYMTLVLAILLAINFFFNDKIKQPKPITKNTENV